MAFDYKDDAVFTPLIRAVLNNSSDDVREALVQGYNANLPDNRGWTPVHLAATEDNRNESLRCLLAHHTADINATTFLKETPLYLACQKNCLKNVKILLKNSKCKINLCQITEMSPLHIACSEGHLKIVKFLIKHGADVNKEDNDGYTPLHTAVATHGLHNRKDEVSYEICKDLLDHGADPDSKDYQGNYPLHIACQNGLLKCVKLLLSASKKTRMVNLRNDDGRTPLMTAVQSYNLPIVELLLSQKANVNIADNMNVIALHLAAHKSDYNMFNLILKETDRECLLKYCTFDEERDFDKLSFDNQINSLTCLAIDTENLTFLIQVLESGLDHAVLCCPVIHTADLFTRIFTLHTPLTFLLESKMSDLGETTVDFICTLVENGIPLKVSSKHDLVNYISPICACLVALNDSPSHVVMKCLETLLQKGADPDEPHGRMPFAMEQAVMRKHFDSILLLLQHTNVLEPEEIIKWIVYEADQANQVEIIKALLPLAPYYTHRDELLPGIIDESTRTALLGPTVHPLSSYCRSVIRKQLHKDTESCPHLFKHYLANLLLPKRIISFLSFK